MIEKIPQLEPRILFAHFHQINQIPRCSKNEKRVGEYLISVAQDKNLEYKQDAVGNLVIRKAAAPGYEHAPTVILQSHTDMVCEKNKDIQHDFTKNPIKMKIEGDWLTADGTTLGADNGIGVAAALAILDEPSLIHGPLELLFTVDEETGLTGATKIQPDFLKGRMLINMDSEEEGILIIGCAGGKDTVGTIPGTYEKINSAEEIPLHISINGLKGGHSGVDIHLNRGNAIKLLGETLQLLSSVTSFRIVSIEGGSKRNAIPREAEAVVVIKKSAFDSVKEATHQFMQAIKNKYASSESKISIAFDSISLQNGKAFSGELTQSIVKVLNELPHGVVAMSKEVPDLVETSTNLATISSKNGQIAISTSQRSSIDVERDAVSAHVAQIFQSCSASVHFTDGYPGWKPNIDSKLLSVAKSVLTKFYKVEPEITVIHAGLECSIIGDKFPDMDMVSFGPTILHAHSPDEKVNIPSVKNFYECLKLMLQRLVH